MLFCTTAFQSKSQSVGVKIDKGTILIGEQVQYDLQVILPAPGYGINFRIPDTVPHFEVIENKNFDTSNSGRDFIVHKKIIFTSFDSGAWYIPSFEVLLEKPNSSQKFMTDSLLVNVGYSPPDSTGELRDIKSVIDVTVEDYFWYYVAAAVLGAVLLGLLVYWYVRKRKRRPTAIFNTSLSAYEEAIQALQKLPAYNEQDAAQVKNYYSELSDIFRRYYSRKVSKDMMNRTTGDILLHLKDHRDQDETVPVIAASLRSADAVKFAKYIPPANEAQQSANQVKEVIGLIEKQSKEKQ